MPTLVANAKCRSKMIYIPTATRACIHETSTSFTRVSETYITIVLCKRAIKNIFIWSNGQWYINYSSIGFHSSSNSISFQKSIIQ